MSVYMTGDIHGGLGRISDLKYFCIDHPDIEWIICLGDVGLNYYGKGNYQEEYIKNALVKFPRKCSVSTATMNVGRAAKTDIKRSKSQKERFVAQCCGILSIPISILRLMVRFM